MRWALRHGWSYDARVWEPLRAVLGGRASTDDRGYYAAPKADAPDEPHILVGHSLGLWRAFAEAGPLCRAIVAINSFDRFAAAPDFPGVPVPLLDTMIERCAVDPGATIRDFHLRLGDAAPLPGTPTPILLDDLRLLRETGTRVAGPALPLLVLDGADDPLLRPAHRAACFPDAARVVLPGGGHLMPLTHPEWCAAQIAAFAACHL